MCIAMTHNFKSIVGFLNERSCHKHENIVCSLVSTGKKQPNNLHFLNHFRLHFHILILKLWLYLRWNASLHMAFNVFRDKQDMIEYDVM